VISWFQHHCPPHLPHKEPSSTTGSMDAIPRMGNFKGSEDVLLASAYASVTMDASIGTDQDGNTFWSKIRDHFVRHGGLAARSIVSIKNRFNKVLQAEVNKYLGNLHTVLREYHSGWGIADYVRKAKTLFLTKNGKQFKHEQVFDVLRNKLPKYEINLASIDSRTARALFLLDSDASMNASRNEEESRTSECTGTGAGEDVVVGEDISLLGPTVSEEDTDVAGRGGLQSNDAAVLRTGIRARSNDEDFDIGMARPLIGKKKAKLLIHTAAAEKNKKATPMNAVAVAIIVEKKNTNDALKRLAEAAEAKNLLADDQIMLQVCLANMHTPQARAYFARRLARLDTNNVQEGVFVVNEVVVTRHENEVVNVDDDDDVNDDDIVDNGDDDDVVDDDSGNAMDGTAQAILEVATGNQVVFVDIDDVVNLPALPDTQLLVGDLRAFVASIQPVFDVEKINASPLRGSDFTEDEDELTEEEEVTPTNEVNVNVVGKAVDTQMTTLDL
jgi:hypothetical protein